MEITVEGISMVSIPPFRGLLTNIDNEICANRSQDWNSLKKIALQFLPFPLMEVGSWTKLLFDEEHTFFKQEEQNGLNLPHIFTSQKLLRWKIHPSPLEHTWIWRHDWWDDDTWDHRRHRHHHHHHHHEALHLLVCWLEAFGNYTILHKWPQVLCFEALDMRPNWQVSQEIHICRGMWSFRFARTFQVCHYWCPKSSRSTKPHLSKAGAFSDRLKSKSMVWSHHIARGVVQSQLIHTCHKHYFWPMWCFFWNTWYALSKAKRISQPGHFLIEHHFKTAPAN